MNAVHYHNSYISNGYIAATELFVLARCSNFSQKLLQGES